jgi:hypothetical protein
MRARSFLAATLVIAVTLLAIPKQADAADKMIYWNDGYYISRANLDGTGRQQLLSTVGNSCGLAIDSKAGKMYWTEYWPEYDTGRIRRSNLDGSMAEDVLAGLTAPLGITLDSVNNRIYLVDAMSLAWTNLDGSNLHYINNGLAGASVSIAVDPTAGKIFWAIPDYGIIQRSDLDGSNIETIITGYNPPVGIAINMIDDKIYWTEDGGGYIGCANFDGSSRQFMKVGGQFDYDIGIALDTDAGKMYWSGVTLAVPSDVYMRCANLDGSAVEYAFSPASEYGNPALSIAFGPVPEPATLLLFALGGLALRRKK